MKRVAIFLILFTAIVFAAPPVSDVLRVTNPTDVEFVDEHADALAKLERLAANRRNWEARRADAAARVAVIDSAIATQGMKIRRGLVRYKPGLATTLPAVLIDANLDRSTPGELTIRWNAAAESHRK